MLKHTIGKAITAIVFSFLILQSCQDSILVGNELLDNEKLVLSFNDSLKLSSSTIAGTRVVTHRPNVNSRTYVLGSLNDATFGNLTTSLYLTNVLASTKPVYTGNIKFDSLVLVLAYDTLGNYGVANPLHQVEVFQLLNTFSKTDTFYSDVKFDANTTPLVSKQVQINTRDSVSYLDHLTSKIVKKRAQLRLRLDDSFGQMLISDTNLTKNDTLLGNFLKGFYIKSTPLSGPSTFGLNLLDASLSSLDGVNKLVMYYTQNDTLKKEYQYPIHASTPANYTYDRMGSEVEKFIDGTSSSDSLAFLQGLGGVKTVVKFDDLSFLEDKLVNRVELEVYVSDLGGGFNLYPAPVQLIASYKNDSGSIQLIQDVSQAISIGSFAGIFGGNVTGTGNLRKYSLNITNHIKNSLKDSTYNSDLYLNVYTESEIVNRAVIYGAKHSTFPMKLNISYTKI